MKKDKKQKPYASFFKNGEQQRKYRNLYKSSKEGLLTYSAWKKEVLDYISKFSNKEEMEDFKHYCLKKGRETKEISNTFLPFILAMIALFPIPSLLNFIRTETIWIFFIGFYAIAGAILTFEYVILKLVIKFSVPQHFYKDIVNIIDEYEKEHF